jgi:hypothetical protein
MPNGHANRKPGPLNLDIYCALIGARPRIAPPTPPSEDADAKSAHEPPQQPFIQAPLREQVGRCAAQLALALEEAKLRLVDLVSTSTTGRRDVRPRRRVTVTIGPAARQARRTAA